MGRGNWLLATMRQMVALLKPVAVTTAGSRTALLGHASVPKQGCADIMAGVRFMSVSYTSYWERCCLNLLIYRNK